MTDEICLFAIKTASDYSVQVMIVLNYVICTVMS